MRRAPFALAVIAGLAGPACDGPDLPDRLWRSEHVRYFSRPADTGVCPAIVDEIEEHGWVIADRLGIEQTIVSYYKFEGEQDFENNAECGTGLSACAPNATVRSQSLFYRHELIHAYLAPYGSPPPLLIEGAAESLSCAHYPRPTGSWRDAYSADRRSPVLYGSGSWLVGHLLRMFRALWFMELYGSLQSNATADTFARVFKQIYGMELDIVWAAAIGGAQAPMDCPWECSRPTLPVDGQPYALSPPCGSGAIQRAVALADAGTSRWVMQGNGEFLLRSCDGREEPTVHATGSNGTAELLAQVAPGNYFIDAVVEPSAAVTVAGSVDPNSALSWVDCASAPILPDDLQSFANLTLFYPTSTMLPRFTRFAAGTNRAGLLHVFAQDGGPATASLCTSCDPQSCSSAAAGQPLLLPTTPAGSVLTVPAGVATSVSFDWL